MKKTGGFILFLCMVLLIVRWPVGMGIKRAAKHKSRLFGATYMTRNNPYFDVLNEGIEEVIEANGDILLTRDPLQDQTKQNQQIDELIKEGIELLFLNPVDWEEVDVALLACQKAGIPIINVDTVVKDREAVISIIETDNYQAGQLCALDMMKRKKQARIVILNNPIQSSITDRTKGFMDTIENHDNFEVVCIRSASGEIEVATGVMGKIIAAGLQFDVVLGGNDPTALGALAALQQSHKEEGVLIYGIDGSPDFKAILERGYVTGTSAQSPKSIGRAAAETAYEYLNGNEVEKYINLPSTFITKDNLHQYELNGWQ